MERTDRPSDDDRRHERTDRQKAGDAAESLVAERLAARGWRILARNVHVGRSELDIVAVDPGPPARLVVVEVRWRRSREFGLAEETFDRRKRAHLKAGVARLLEVGRLAGGGELPHLPLALDLAIVEPGAGDRPAIRLYRNALAG
ncbi:MAG: YraN family protein [Candidatus Limnocylindrales bacterium]|jgi:putative endonuclease